MSRYSTSSTSQTIDNGKKKSLMQDNSWIRRVDDEDDLAELDGETTRSVSSSTSVHSLTKRFTGSQDELRTSSIPSSKTSSSYTKTTYSTEEPRTSTTTTTVTKGGKTTETIITTNQSLKSPGIKSPTTFTERVMSSSRDVQYPNYSPSRTLSSSKDAEDQLYDKLIPSTIRDDYPAADSKTSISKTETVIVKSGKTNDDEDNFYDTYRSRSRDNATDNKTTVSSTESVTVRNGMSGDGTITSTKTRTASKPEDELYGTLLPSGITSSVKSSTVSKSSVSKREVITVESSRSSYSDLSSIGTTTSYSISSKPSTDSKTYSYSRPDTSYEYSSVTSPSVYTSSSYRSSSRSEDMPDSVFSKSSSKSVYGAPDRLVLEKDLCTYCRKPFTADAKMVLEDLSINCHASCFKCGVCNSSLSHLKAGDSMWVYKRMVHCENCFEITRDKWRR